MSLLSEIEARARDRTERRAVVDEASRARQALDEERVRPLLQGVESYLRRAAVALNSTDPAVTVSYAVADLGELEDLQQGNYLLDTDAEREEVVRFRFVCTGTRPLKGALSSEALARARELSLVGSGLTCQRVVREGQRRGLLVDPRVPVTLGFQRSGLGLRLRTRNLLGLETRFYTLPPERIDDEFMDALLEVVMRRGNRLPQLTGDTIDDVERAQLRRDLAREERRHRAELSGFFGRAVFPITEAFRRYLLRQ